MDCNYQYANFTHLCSNVTFTFFCSQPKGNISKKTVITLYSAQNVAADNFSFGTNTASTSYTLSAAAEIY